MKIYLVGGAVRDKQLGLNISDKDWLVVGATPEEMRDKGYTAVGKSFPVFLHPNTKEEYALARTEVKSGKGYHGFQFVTDKKVTLEEDLKRRDLTINAMAEDESGHLIDPFNGLNDIKHKRLRHVSDAFKEDPLRVLRTARFQAQLNYLGFGIAKETLALMQEISASGELKFLSSERIWQETLKALLSSSPSAYFETLRAVGALKELFPEIDQLYGVSQPEKHHPEVDCGIHTMMVIDQAAKLDLSDEARFACLVHDLGKGTTPKDILPKHIGHESRGIELIMTLCHRLRIPKRFEQLALLVARYHSHCHRAFELRPKTLLDLLHHLSALRHPKRFEDFLMACLADHKGRKGFEDHNYPQADYLMAAKDAIATISSKPFIEKGLKGKDLGDAIFNQQLEVLVEFKKSYN
ncbi:multifunctional CCA addition/repair protein [Thiotrichales bacterium 19S11-10]|nr:multifunctional CCA addition/repair protein [Thiotrichales bacterium 19S11-10]